MTDPIDTTVGDVAAHVRMHLTPETELNGLSDREVSGVVALTVHSLQAMGLVLTTRAAVEEACQARASEALAAMATSHQRERQGMASELASSPLGRQVLEDARQRAASGEVGRYAAPLPAELWDLAKARSARPTTIADPAFEADLARARAVAAARLSTVGFGEAHRRVTAASAAVHDVRPLATVIVDEIRATVAAVAGELALMLERLYKWLDARFDA